MSRHKFMRSKKLKFNCAVCKIAAFILKAHRPKHLRIQSGKKEFSCYICKRQFDGKREAKRHPCINQGVREEFACVFCGIKLGTKIALDNHILGHINETLWDINVCHKSCVNESSLKPKGHINSDPSKVNSKLNHFCIICRKIYPTNCNLLLHMQCHIREKPFSCSKCEKSFAKNSSYQRHVRVLHKKVKPHVCEICGKRFIRTDYLQDHLRRHLGEKCLECKVCKKKFVASSELASHEKRNKHCREKL